MSLTRTPRIPTAALAAVLAAHACAPHAGASAGASPTGSPAASPASASASGPRVVFPSGASVDVEIARSDAERAQGLMYRASMPKEHGMIFLFEGLEIRPFWMKNCHFPLDLIYATKDGTVVDVLRDVPPCPADPCPNFPPKTASDTVVEVNAGVAPANGVVPGAKIRYVGIDGR